MQRAARSCARNSPCQTSYMPAPKSTNAPIGAAQMRPGGISSYVFDEKGE